MNPDPVVRSAAPRWRRSCLRAARPGAVFVLVLSLGGGLAGDLSGQEPERERWSDWLYQPGAWVDGRLAPAGEGAHADSLALVATVEAYARGSRWRAEVRRVDGGRELAEPIVLVGRGDEVRVLTPLGATAFDEHAAAEDALVRAVVAGFDEGRSREGVRDARFELARPAGGPAWTAVRTVAARADFPDARLEWGTARRLGREALRFGVHAVGAERDEEVVATIGARGVAEVQTVDGVIEVLPDTAAIHSLERDVPTILELDRFIRSGALVGGVGRQPLRREEDR